MTIGSQNLSSQITTRLAASPSGLSCCQLEGARDILATASVVSVASVAALPNPADNKGRFFFVENICAYRYSDGLNWTNDYNTGNGLFIAYTWGDNTCGRLGDGTVVTRALPDKTIGVTTPWCQIDAGGSHTVAIKKDGTAWTWGSNNCGQLGNGSVVNRSSPSTVAGGGNSWCQINAGNLHTAAVKTDGTAWTWGLNNTGQLGDLTVVNKSSPVTVSGGGNTWYQIEAGACHTSAIKTDGTAWTWGNNNCGQLGDGTVIAKSSPNTVVGGGNTWCQISSGYNHTVAVKTDGTAWTWGGNFVSFFPIGQLGDNTTANRCSPGTTSGGGTTWCQISAGVGVTAAVKTDGTAWTWGMNCAGQLGNYTTTSRSSPGTTQGGGTTWCQISAGGNHLAAVKTDGTALAWGCNNCGQLGLGFVGFNICFPAGFSNSTTWCQISAGGTHTAAIEMNYSRFSAPL